MSCENKLYVNKRFVLIAFFMNFVYFIAILITVLVAVPDRPDLTNTKQLCLPTRKGLKLACGSPKDILSQFLTESFDYAYKNYTRVEKTTEESLFEIDPYMFVMYRATKPAARFSSNNLAKITEKQGLSDRMTTVFEWKPENDLEDIYEFQRLKVTNRNGRILVRVSGTYQVYSFLDLYEELKPNDSCSNRDRAIIHGIYVFNFTERNEKELVTSCHLHQSTSNRRFNIYSSFVMTLVDLRAGDEVMVKVNDLSLLQYPVFNTFGLNLV